MKKMLILIAVSAGLIMASYSWAQDAVPPADHPANTAGTVHKGEHHPELHKALHKLKAAKEDLEKAAHDYAGHRAKAIAAIDQAIAEIHEAYKSDKK